MSLLLLSERAGPATSAEHEALDLLLARAGRALDTAGHSDELQRREERFRSLLQHASDLITVLDAEGRVTYQSDASRALFASPHDGLTNDPFETVVHPEDRSRLNDMLSAVTSTDELAPRARAGAVDRARKDLLANARLAQ